MTRYVRSEWHVDGTRTPCPWKRGGQPPEIWGRHTAEAVPLRAIRPDLHKWALFWVFRVMFALVGWGLTVVLGTLRGVVL